MKDQALRDHVLYLLGGGGAHIGFEAAVADLPPELRGRRPAGLPYSPWMLLEHMRLAQWDILEYSRNAEHISPDWPGGYWPASDGPPDAAAWDRGVEHFRADLDAMRELVSDPGTDLLSRIPWGEGGHTVLREALLAADHNAYHIGQMVAVRRLLGAWEV